MLTYVSRIVFELSEDMAVVKKDIAQLKEDVAVLKHDVAALKEDMIIVKRDLNVLTIAVDANHRDYSKIRYALHSAGKALLAA